MAFVYLEEFNSDSEANENLHPELQQEYLNPLRVPLRPKEQLLPIRAEKREAVNFPTRFWPGDGDPILLSLAYSEETWVTLRINHLAKSFQLWLKLVRIPLIDASFNIHVNLEIRSTKKLHSKHRKTKHRFFDGGLKWDCLKIQMIRKGI